MNKALTYFRVSTKRLTKEGDTLAPQTARCREFAPDHNMKVMEVLQDAQSGSSTTGKINDESSNNG